MKYYAGIGSRKTPNSVLRTMRVISAKLAGNGYILRSGGALGADIAFEAGVTKYSSKEIFYVNDATEQSMILAAPLHPNWKNLSHYVKQLMGRNMMQILGKDLKTPVEFVICWTPDGC